MARRLDVAEQLEHCGKCGEVFDENRMCSHWRKVAELPSDLLDRGAEQLEPGQALFNAAMAAMFLPGKHQAWVDCDQEQWVEPEAELLYRIVPALRAENERLRAALIETHAALGEGTDKAIALMENDADGCGTVTALVLSVAMGKAVTVIDKALEPAEQSESKTEQNKARI
jgi:hypothetical protein